MLADVEPIIFDEAGFNKDNSNPEDDIFL